MSDISIESFTLYEIDVNFMDVDNKPINWILNINGVYVDRIIGAVVCSIMFAFKQKLMLFTDEFDVFLNNSPDECFAISDEMDKLLYCIKVV